MLLGLDAIPLTEAKTGVGHYTFELARALADANPADEIELTYPSTYAPLNLRDDFRDDLRENLRDDNEQPATLPLNLREVRVPVGTLERHWWALGLPRHLRKHQLKLFHGTNYDVPLWSGCPAVLTIHDLSAYLQPDTHLPQSVRRLRRRLPLMIRAARLIITPTESVRREVCEHLGVSPAKIVAVPEAPRRIFQPLARADALALVRQLGITDDFLLAVGTVEPRKNLLTLVRAFEEVKRLDRTPKNLRLVIAGKSGWLTGEFFAYLRTSNAREHIHLTGYVSDAELRVLYAACLAFIYPSLYEGFGLPPLEAMACAAPVIASRISALTETLGDEAALFFPPTDAAALARSVLEVTGHVELRRRLSQAGLARAAAYSWERTAGLTRRVYEQALGSKNELR